MIAATHIERGISGLGVLGIALCLGSGEKHRFSYSQGVCGSGGGGGGGRLGPPGPPLNLPL